MEITSDFIQLIIAVCAAATVVGALVAFFMRQQVKINENRIVSDLKDQHHNDQVKDIKASVGDLKTHLTDHITLDDEAHDKIRAEIKDVDKKIDKLHDKLHDKLDDMNKNISHLTGFVKKNLNGNGNGKH